MTTAHTTPAQPGGPTGRRWAYGGLALGLVVSEAANVAHSWVPPNGAAHGWTPDPGAVLGALFWPLALFVAIEILARVAWPDGGWWRLARFGGLIPVAAVAAFVSYRHMSGLLLHYGEDGATAHLGPIAVDGLMVMATAALLGTSPAHRPAPAVADAPTTAPARAGHTEAAHAAPSPERTAVTPGTPRLTAVRTTTRKRPARAAKTPAPVAAARDAAAELEREGKAVGRRNLTERLRARGYSCSSEHAEALLREINQPTAQEA